MAKRLPVDEAKFALRGVHAKHHVKWLKVPAHGKKDLATPLRPSATALSRCRMRRHRVRNGGAAKVPESLHNVATRAALRAALGTGGRPPGIPPQSWAPHKISEVPAVVGDVSWTAVRRKIDREAGEGRHVSLCWCTLCGASSSASDWCAASLIPGMNWKAFEEFFNYCQHPKNVLGHFLDPEDQRQLQLCLSTFAGVTLRAEVDEGSAIRLACRVCLYLSIVAIPTSVTTVAEALLQDDWVELERAINRVPDGELFRGGQRPFSGGRRGLAMAVMNFDKEHGQELSDELVKLKRSGCASVGSRVGYESRNAFGMGAAL